MPFNSYENVDTSIFNPQEAPAPAKYYGSDYINQNAAIASQLKGGSDGQVYEDIKSNLVQTGADPRLDAIKADSMAKKAEATLELSQSFLVDPSFTPEDKIDIIQKIGEEALRDTPDIIGEYADYNIENPLPHNTEEEAQANLKRQTYGNDIAETSRAIQALNQADLTEYAREKAGDTVDLLGDTAALVVIPGQQSVYRNIFEDAVPGFAAQLDLSDYVDVGVAKRKFKNFVDTLSMDDRVRVHRQLLQSVSRHLGTVTDDNRIEKMFLNNELTDLIDPQKTYGETEQTFDTVLGALDAWPVLSMAASGARAGIGSFRHLRNVAEGSNLNILNKADPGKAQEIAKQQLKTPDSKLDEVTGTHTSGIILDHSFPKARTTRTPEGFDMASAEGDYKKIFGVGSDPVNYKANKASRADAQIDKTLQRLTEKVPFIHISKSRVLKHNLGMDYEVIVGQTDTIGFQSLGEAHDAARGFSEADSGYRVMAKTKTGDLVPEGEVEVDKLSDFGEYFVEFKTTQKYDTDDLMGMEGEYSLLVDNGLTGSKAKYADPSSVFIPEHVRRIAAAVNKSAAFSKEANELLRPYVKLKKTPWKQAKVLKALEKGEIEGKWLDTDDLIQEFNGVHEDLMNAYNGFRRSADVAYLEQNARLYTKWDKEGYLDLQVDDWHSIGVPLKTTEELDDVSVVFDPVLKQFVDMDQSSIRALAGENRMISRNIDRISETTADGRNIGTYYVVHKVDGVTELPPYVLNYRAGYITRTYDEPYKITETIDNVYTNGKKVDKGISRAVHFAPGKKAAAREADRLAGATPNAKYTPEATRELLNATEDFDAIYDEARSQGRVYFSKRGQEVNGTDGKRTVGNMTDSVSRMIASVTKHHALGDIVEGLKGDWLKSYRGFTPDQKNFPTSKSGMVPPVDVRKTEEYDRAVATMEHINHIAGQNNGLGVKMWRKKISQLANLVESENPKGFFATPRNKLSNSLLDSDSLNPFTLFMNIGRSPLSMLKAATFVKVIALNPIRQMTINLAQMSVYAGVEGGAAYMTKFASKQGWYAEHALLLAGMSSRHMGSKSKNTVRTVAMNMINTTMPLGKKVTLKDIDDLTEDFHKSGLMQNIDGHQFLNSTATERADSTIGGNALGTVGKYAKEYLISAPVSVGKQGFVLGETANISTAWLVARNGIRNSDPAADLRSTKNIEYMSGRASEISYNMNKSGEIAYQQGALSGFFQFMSVQQKALQALIPEKIFGKTIGKLAGKQFHWREKRRIAMIQTGLFGTAGLGLTEAYNSIVDKSGVKISPADNSIIQGGFVDYMVNGLGELATGEEQALLASRSLAPISAIGASAGLLGVFDAAFSIAAGQGVSGQPLTAMDALGASGNVVSSLGKLTQTMRYVALQEKADAASPEDYQIILEDSLSILSSGVSNYFKARLYTNLGREYTNNGIAKFKTTQYEQWGKALFGLQNSANQDMNALTFELIKGSKKGGKDPRPERASIEADAKLLYDMMNKFAVRKTEGTLTDRKFDENLRAISLIYNMAYTEDEKDYLMQTYSKMMKYDTRLEGAEYKLPMALLKARGEGWMNSKDALINKMERLDLKGEYRSFIDLMREELPDSSSVE